MYHNIFLRKKISGSSCSKLTMSLVNVSLKLWSYFCWKNVSSFCICTFFFSKNTCELDIVLTRTDSILGPVVQSVVILTSSLVVKILTVLVSTISNSQVFLLKKNVSSFCKCKSYSHFFSKNITIYTIYNDQSFNDKLTNNIVSFEQLGPDH